MKLKNYIDNTYYVLCNSYFIICLVCAALAIVLNVSIMHLSFGIVGIIFIATLMYFFYAREYSFNKNDFTIKIGFIIRRFKYKDVKKSYITKNNRLSYATSKKRIAIKFKGRKGKEIYISPERMDEALLKLINSTGGK